jgi:predicted sugar kinase
LNVRPGEAEVGHTSEGFPAEIAQDLGVSQTGFAVVPLSLGGFVADGGFVVGGSRFSWQGRLAHHIRLAV